MGDDKTPPPGAGDGARSGTDQKPSPGGKGGSGDTRPPPKRG